MRNAANWTSSALSSLCAAGAAAITLLATQPAFSQDRIEIVHFQSLTFPGSLFTPPFMPPAEKGTPATIFGILEFPEGDDRVPAVVLSHGCSGITGAETYWGSSLPQLGVATFVVNSFVGRSFTNVCRGHTISMANSSRMFIARGTCWPTIRASIRVNCVDGIFLGGSTALWANHLRFQQRYDRGPSRFVAHLAFYPNNCFFRLADEDRVSDAPIRIFHGAADDAALSAVAGSTSPGCTTRARTWSCSNMLVPSTGSITSIRQGGKRCSAS